MVIPWRRAAGIKCRIVTILNNGVHKTFALVSDNVSAQFAPRPVRNSSKTSTYCHLSRWSFRYRRPEWTNEGILGNTCSTLMR